MFRRPPALRFVYFSHEASGSQSAVRANSGEMSFFLGFSSCCIAQCTGHTPCLMACEDGKNLDCAFPCFVAAKAAGRTLACLFVLSILISRKRQCAILTCVICPQSAVHASHSIWKRKQHLHLCVSVRFQTLRKPVPLKAFIQMGLVASKV